MKSKNEIPKTSLISFMSSKVKKNGGINFAQGIPGFKPPLELLDILKDISHEDYHQYAAGRGDYLLKTKIIEKHSSAINNLSEENLMITNGITEALSLIFTWLNEKIKTNRNVLSFSPVYESYQYLPQIFGFNYSSYDLSEGKFTPELFKDIIIKEKVKILILGSPGNPYGYIFTKEELDFIKKISLELDFYLIIDAVYQDFYFEKRPYYPIANLDQNIFYLNGFSKSLSITGWRIGYLLANSENLKEIEFIHDYTGLCSPSILQKAIALYLDKYDYGKTYTAMIRQKLKNNFGELSEILLNQGFTIPKTAGGYFVWTKLPSKIKVHCFDFCLELYQKTKVALVPGIHFDKKATDYLRLNIAREQAEFKMGIERLLRYLTEAVQKG